MQKLIVILLVLLALTTVSAAQPVVDYLNINADVNNGYAITTVEEKLTNPLDTPSDDEFKFLIPEVAFISGFGAGAGAARPGGTNAFGVDAGDQPAGHHSA